MLDSLDDLWYNVVWTSYVCSIFSMINTNELTKGEVMRVDWDIGKSPDHGRPEERPLPEPDEDIPRTLPGFYVCQRCGAFITADELRTEHCPAAPSTFHRTLDD